MKLQSLSQLHPLSEIDNTKNKKLQTKELIWIVDKHMWSFYNLFCEDEFWDLGRRLLHSWNKSSYPS